jgi:integrase
MPKVSRDKLSDPTIKAAKFEGRAHKLHDGDGLFLHVKHGGKYWHFRFWLGVSTKGKAKERLMSLGVYPKVSLSGARKERDKARVLLAQGIDPVSHRREQEARKKVSGANTFEAVAREWWEDRHRHDSTPAHAERNLRRLELYIFPHLGTDPIAGIDSLRLLNALRSLERAGKVPTAHKVKDVCSQVFEYAIVTNRATANPAKGLGRRALRPEKEKHHPAPETPEQLAQLLRAIDKYGGEPTTMAALKLSALLFPRPGELRSAQWDDFDLEAGTWDFSPSKGGRPLLTPLPRQALDILRELRKVTGPQGYIFPSAQGGDGPISNATLGTALRRVIKRHGLDFDAVPHGFRATARTLLVEALDEEEHVVELQLTHTVRDRLGRAYNRTTLIEQRGAMLQRWANYLDKLREGVISLTEAAA